MRHPHSVWVSRCASCKRPGFAVQEHVMSTWRTKDEEPVGHIWPKIKSPCAIGENGVKVNLFLLLPGSIKQQQKSLESRYIFLLSCIQYHQKQLSWRKIKRARPYLVVESFTFSMRQCDRECRKIVVKVKEIIVHLNNWKQRKQVVSTELW